MEIKKSHKVLMLSFSFMIFISLLITNSYAQNQDKNPMIFVDASSNNFPPMNSLDNNGNLIGFGKDLADSVMKAVGAKVTHIHSSQWVDVLKWLDSGKADFIHDTGYTQERDQFLDYGTLAAGIAHDFNNMCAVITGNLSYALSTIDSGSELYDVLSDIQNGTNQAKKLTGQLLTFSKGGVPVKETVDLNELIAESANFILRGAKSICNYDLSNDLWTCNVDKVQLSQVVNNLVLNANQAMPNGGTMRIRTGNTYIKSNEIFPLNEGQYIKITVEDEGTGISEKHIPNIFDPFFTTKQQGSGLGLATVYSIIKKHDGHITVHSELDKGTAFHIYLPSSNREVEKKQSDEQVSHQSKGKVLIMDDQESILKMVDRMLTRMGDDTVFALDGAEAVEKFREANLSETF